MAGEIFYGYGFYRVADKAELDGILTAVRTGQVAGARFAAAITGEWDAFVAFTFQDLPSLEQAIFALRSESSTAIAPEPPSWDPGPKMRGFVLPLAPPTCLAFVRVWVVPGADPEVVRTALMAANPGSVGVVVAGDFNILLELGDAATSPADLWQAVSTLIGIPGVREARVSLVSRWAFDGDPTETTTCAE